MKANYATRPLGRFVPRLTLKADHCVSLSPDDLALVLLSAGSVVQGFYDHTLCIEQDAILALEQRANALSCQEPMQLLIFDSSWINCGINGPLAYRWTSLMARSPVLLSSGQYAACQSIFSGLDSLSSCVDNQMFQEQIFSVLVGLIANSGLTPKETKKAQSHEMQLDLWLKFQALVDEHVLDNWSIGQYARSLMVSESALFQCCRKRFDQSPQEVILLKKVALAKRFLENEKYTIKEIAFRLHFNDPGYFSRFFHRATGELPRAYRARVLTLPNSELLTTETLAPD